MAKKTAKIKKKAPVKKPSGKAPAPKAKAAKAPAKAAKPAPKAKAKAAPVGKKTIIKTKPHAPAKAATPAKAAAAPKVAAKAPPAKGSVLKNMAKAVVGAAKKAVDKVEKEIKEVTKATKPAPAAKAEKPAPEAKKTKGKVAEVEEPEILEEAIVEEDDADEEIVLTDAEGRRYCRVKDCDQVAIVDGYCRYHYLALWKKIQVRKKILSEGKLERYIEELTARYPDKFLEMLRKDLRSEKEFLSAIQELEIDENAVDNEFEDEAQNYIDEVRGMEPAARDDEDF